MRSLTPTWSTRKSASTFEDFDRLFDGFLGMRESKFTPQCDIEEYEKFFKLSFDVPGLKPEDLKLEVQGNQLVVSGERKLEKNTNEKGWSRFERNYGSFQRLFTLPDVADFNDIEAHHELGVLEITIPKTEISKSKKIEIKAKSDSGRPPSESTERH